MLSSLQPQCPAQLAGGCWAQRGTIASVLGVAFPPQTSPRGQSKHLEASLAFPTKQEGKWRFPGSASAVLLEIRALVLVPSWKNEDISGVDLGPS